MEGDFAAELDDAVLAVGLTVAIFIALVDVPAAGEVKVAQAGSVMLAHGVGEHLAAVFGSSVFEAHAVKVLAPTLPSVLGAAFTTDHEILRRFRDAFAEDILVHKFEIIWRGRAIDVIMESDCG